MQNQRKSAISLVALCLVMVLFYYNIFNIIQPSTAWRTAKRFYARTLEQKVMPPYDGKEDYLINTPGCRIPNYMKHIKLKEAAYITGSCYKRFVFVEKTSENEVTFRIDYKNVTQKNHRLKCAYQFVRRSNVRGQEDTNIILSEPKPFEDGDKIKQEEEVIAVSCDVISPKNKKISTYSDVYLILKKKPTDLLKIPIKDNVVLVKENWNVLLVGMDTISRARAYHSLPKTVKYLQDNGWLDYRGYQKIAENTFPNTMAILSGKNASSAYHDCRHGMDQCEIFLIWNKFREAGYITAYGEDNLGLPDTFSPYKGFTLPPTDHYTRPLFLMGEYGAGNIVCTRTRPSAQHLLDYSLQFVKAYIHDNFFGYFWINSYSHNLHNVPTLFEDDLIAFFDKLKRTGAMNNTFVFFLSDHGLRFGPQRIPKESYYEERLPMLFIWVPYDYRELYPNENYNLLLNQFRFTTPYDLHATLVNIMKKTDKDIEADPPEACPQCTSLTEEVSPNRTCEEANVDQKWCSCHGFNKARIDDAAAKTSLHLAVEYVQDRAKTIKTESCTYCSPLSLKTVLRNDWYKNGNKTYYVVAFQLEPGDVAFEATVEHNNEEFRILHPTTTISQYNVRGRCVLNKYESPYCVCLKVKKCKRIKKIQKVIPHPTGKEDYLIKTPGCTIPNYMKTLKFKDSSDKKRRCNQRVVFVDRISEDEVTFRIEYDKVIKKTGQSFSCAYQFVLRSNKSKVEDFHVIYTNKKTFRNGDKIKLEEEVIIVSCDLFSSNHTKISSYSDAYLILKKRPVPYTLPSDIQNIPAEKEKWNILIIGLDTMSRGRAYHSLPKTVKYLNENQWLDYRGYQKIASNTFPNIIAMLTGKNMSVERRACNRGMDYCQQDIIWNKFKEAGYMTAFGEDFLRLPDTFSRFKGFTKPPTDHYARPLFITGEYASGNIICTRAKPSAEHLLDYSLQFVQTYKQDNFFGLFWINSYSHEVINLPALFEDYLISYLKNLKSSGALNNTFVFFLSDHGIRFGPNRLPSESYYAERLPMLFISVPYDFRRKYSDEYDNLLLNQFRFTTPYDLYATLVNILVKSSNNIDVSIVPEGCSRCTSLTKEISPHRTCETVNVDQKWCTCHSLESSSFKHDFNTTAYRSLDFVVKYVQNRSILAKTIKCATCSSLKLNRVIRNDMYTSGNKTYYVIALNFHPGDVAFEATVESFGDELNILGPTDPITSWNSRGSCALNSNDSPYCVCRYKKCK